MHAVAAMAASFPAYVILGRTGFIVSSLALGVHPVFALGVSLALDWGQLTAYGLLLDRFCNPRKTRNRFARWIEKRRERWQERLAKGGWWSRLAQTRPLLVMTVATVPVRGFGVLSATLLAFMLGFSPVRGTLAILAGALLGGVATLALYYGGVEIAHGL